MIRDALTYLLVEAGLAEYCRYRGCMDEGVYWMRRHIRNDQYQTGYYCDAHHTQFGEENLQRWAREIGGDVVWMADEEGRFRGVVNKDGIPCGSKAT